MRDATKHAVSIGGWCGEDEPTNPEQLAEWSNKCLRPKSREVECRWLAWRTSGWFWRVLRWFTLRFTFVTLESIYDSIKNVFASQRRKHKIGKERKITCSGSAGSESTEIWGGEGGGREGRGPQSLGPRKLVSCSHKRRVLESQGKSICDIMHERLWQMYLYSNLSVNVLINFDNIDSNWKWTFTSVSFQLRIKKSHFAVKISVGWSLSTGQLAPQSGHD